MLARSLGVARAWSCAWKGNCWRAPGPCGAWSTGWRQREELLEAADALAQRLSRRSPQAVRLIKRSIYQAAPATGRRAWPAKKAGSPPPQGNTRRAMREYIERVRTITREERPFRREDFDDLTEGNAIDMAYR
ncbi:hypothetical protein ID032_33595 [Pseudomonas aeruginosa]|uniref:hypothetical protein n=1 Tax=Pseudomonas aeruginosa TaxID=287 RepID=UPI001ADC4A7D|nr:hypothetical protein [Pseudomonas aeruginosa]MBO8350630.1 hypothetical protein [Pseudomonas aeruginosa]